MHLAPGLVRRLLGSRSRTATPFGRDRAGGVALIFALALIPVGLMIGAAIDYNRAIAMRTALNAAADAAALSAVTQAGMTLNQGQARKAALDFFNARAGLAKEARNIQPSVSVNASGSQRVAVVSYAAEVATGVFKLAGWSNIAIAGTATATSALPAYIDFHLLLDNTPSMGVGATPSDVAKMVANTSDKCAFACHDLSANGNDYYALAKKLGVTMRIDVVRQATQKLMDTAAATAVVGGQFRMAIHTFGPSCAPAGLATLTPLTWNLTSAKASAAAIDLMTVPYQNYYNDQCTDYDGNFAAVNALISSPGDGTSASTPQKVLLFVSDGVADASYPSTCSRPTTGGRCQEPMTLANCTALKDRGIRIAVLYTTYLPLPTNGWYNTWISPFASSIPSRMQACASPELYFEVSPTEGIADAMDALFKKAVQQARLSN
jgi:Flp pilus assembly protein TadG